MAFVLFSARSCRLRLPVLTVRAVQPVRPACAEVDLLDCLDCSSCLFFQHLEPSSFVFEIQIRNQLFVCQCGATELA
jgi:hypothetical protein